MLSSGRDEYDQYDHLDRLKQRDCGTLNGTRDGITGTPTKSEIFTLDATGNWTEYVTKTNGTTDLDHTRSHDKANELTGFPTTPTGTAWATPGYDEAGNMTTLPQPASPAQSFTAEYDAWNRLTRISRGFITQALYSYDGLVRLIRERDDHRGRRASVLYSCP